MTSLLFTPLEIRGVKLRRRAVEQDIKLARAAGIEKE
jgi:hypothetical protein